jgi:hypothetical protein
VFAADRLRATLGTLLSQGCCFVHWRRRRRRRGEEDDERDEDDEEEFYIAEIKSQVEYKDGLGRWEDLCTPCVWRCGKRGKPYID